MRDVNTELLTDKKPGKQQLSGFLFKKLLANSVTALCLAV
jgi:hypothetical protein